jgi:glycosyltransferase involved in cell wall biosynthesis
MMAGLPVIASNFPLWSEIVLGSSAGLCVDPLKPDAIAEAAFRMSAKPDETLEMGRRGQLAVSQQYNWQQESKRLVALYGELVGASRRHAQMASGSGDRHHGAPKSLSEKS